MKLHRKRIYTLIGCILLTNSVYANNTVTAAPSMPGKIYVGIFGGGGSSTDFNAAQYGTAFFPEFIGGPLAVNAFGKIQNPSTSFWGAQLGYQAANILVVPCAQWSLAPAAEIEGLSLRSRTFRGNLPNNTTQLPEHDFDVTYPMSRNVFLVNAVLTVNHPCLFVHPYIGFGIGGAIARISGAESTQLSPMEIGINHYNASASDTDTTFAGQVKIGLSYNFNDMFGVFAEYRRLYISNTHFNFGSTVYPTHVATSSWLVKLDPQRFNLGSIGFRINL